MKCRLFKAEEVECKEGPGYVTKMLINPDNSDTQYLDFRISRFHPGGCAEPHTHRVSENLYYILQGHGVVVLDGERHTLEPHTVVHIPPKVEHCIINNGHEDLVLIFMASPPTDMPRS